MMMFLFKLARRICLDKTEDKVTPLSYRNLAARDKDDAGFMDWGMDLARSGW